jgi:hypothetical protein
VDDADAQSFDELARYEILSGESATHDSKRTTANNRDAIAAPAIATRATMRSSESKLDVVAGDSSGGG